ncbi:MAG TPA: alpha/beta hydrolase [Rhizomicrobium sp.]
MRAGWAEIDLGPVPPVVGEVFVSASGGLESLGARRPDAAGFSLFGELQTRMAGAVPDTILFIHGFDYRFDEALVGLGLLKQRLDIGKFGPANMVLFTWPSDGTLRPFLSYASDRRDAKESGVAGGHALLELADFLKSVNAGGRNRGRIHIVAHSMGVYVLRNALQGLVRELPAVQEALFDQVLLIAGDEDHDALELDQKLAPLARLSKRIHVYYNPHDVVLDLCLMSRRVARRLGLRGPRNAAAVPGQVVLVDASNVSRWTKHDWDFHHYYLHAFEMAADMAHVLMGTAEDNIPGRTPVPGSGRSFRLDAAPDLRRR